MSEIDITQHRLCEDDFAELGELHPQGVYKICDGEGRRTTWFTMIISINKWEVDLTWHLDQYSLDEDGFTKLCEHLNKRYDTADEDNHHYFLGDTE